MDCPERYSPPTRIGRWRSAVGCVPAWSTSPAAVSTLWHRSVATSRAAMAASWEPTAWRSFLRSSPCNCELTARLHEIVPAVGATPRNRPTRRSGWTLSLRGTLAMRTDDAKRHLAVVVGDLLGTPRALVAVPAGDVDAQGQQGERRHPWVGGAEGSGGDAGPHDPAHLLLDRAPDADDLAQVLRAKRGELVVDDARAGVAARMVDREFAHHGQKLLYRVVRGGARIH